MKINQHFFIRKTHRYLGVVIGVQFFLWTVGGLYFSWTDIDRIHGDHFKNPVQAVSTVPLGNISTILDPSMEVHSLETRVFSGIQYYWINGEKLVHATTGEEKGGVSAEEAQEIAKEHILPGYQMKTAEYLEAVGPHHEYRGQALPAWMITYEGKEKLRVYISAKDGKLQRVRYDSWRIFDFLWMLHIMDYNTRDDINNWILRGFSVLGMLTICSGFLLFIYSSKTIKKRKILYQSN